MIEFDSASAIVGDTATVRHLLHIEGYSRTKSLPMDERIDCQPFTVGGRTWRIRYYPGGIHFMGIAHTRDVVFVVLLDDSIPEPAHAETRFLLLDRAGNEMPDHTLRFAMNSFSYPRYGYGYAFFIKREFVEKEVLANDCFKIRLDICVLIGLRSENRGTTMESAAVPPSDLHRHLGDLLVAGDGADVTFQVADETFRTHKCVLAARSPVFKALLFGAMREGTTAAEDCIRIHDMVPQVFGALLHFVYTDSLPEMTEQEEGEEAVMAQHLFEAADRYDMPKLKLACEEKLCGSLDTHTAATTLVLADQHNCLRLKKACIEFLRCPQAWNAVMATDGFELIRSYPDLLEELSYEGIASCDMEEDSRIWFSSDNSKY